MSSQQGSTTGTAERPVGYLEKPMGFWQKLPHRSDTGGVAPMTIEGKEKFMVERMRGMTPERRAWRKQWVADQHLSSREPVFVEQLYKELNHPIKRAYNWPFNQAKKLLLPYAGEKIAEGVRAFLKAQFVLISLGCFITYMVMYNPNRWDHAFRGVGINMRKPMVYPGEALYPFVSTMEMDDYGSRGFKKSAFFKSEEQIRAEQSQ